MSSRSTCPLDCKVYVGDLGNNGDRRELEDVFGKYGPLRNVWVARNPPGFAFVEFENPRDADDATREMDGRTVCGRRVRVELSSGRSKPKRYGEENGGGRGGGGGRDRDRRDDRRDSGRRDKGRRSRSGSRERRRSRSPRDVKDRREKSRSASPKPERRRVRSEEKNGSDGPEE